MDPLCSKILLYLTEGERPKEAEGFPEWMKHIEFFNVENGILYHNYLPASHKKRNQIIVQVVLSLTMRKTIVKEYHDQPTAGHLAYLRTFLNIQKRYYWPNMSTEIKEYCKACVKCQETKKLSYSVRPLLRPIDVARAPFDTISIDFMGPFPKSRQGNSYIMVTTCLFSKFVNCVALERITALTTAHALVKRIFYQHGAPRCILSDRGSQFTSTLFKHLLQILNIEQKLTTAWHPQCNGQTERANRSLCQMIRGYINDQHDNWEDLLEPIRFAYCNSIHSCIGFSPWFICFGRDPVMLIDQVMNAVNDRVITPKD